MHLFSQDSNLNKLLPVIFSSLLVAVILLSMNRTSEVH